MDEDKIEKVKDEEKEESRDESLDEIIEGEEVSTPRRIETIENSISGDFMEGNNFESFIQPSIETTITPQTPKRNRTQDFLEETAEREGIREQNFETERKEEKNNYSTGYDLREYEAVDRERKSISDQHFVARTSGRSEPEQMIVNIPREMNMRVNPELEEMRRGSPGHEDDYIAKAGRLQQENRLPFQEQTKYKGKPI